MCRRASADRRRKTSTSLSGKYEGTYDQSEGECRVVHSPVVADGVEDVECADVESDSDSTEIVNFKMEVKRSKGSDPKPILF